MTAHAQRENVRKACEAIAPIAEGNEIVVSHGNGPQVGLLALQQAAYTGVEPYPLDMLGAETEGMIGYVIEQELGNLLPPERPFATKRPTGSPSRRGGPSPRTATAGDASSLLRSRNGSSRRGP